MAPQLLGEATLANGVIKRVYLDPEDGYAQREEYLSAACRAALFVRGGGAGARKMVAITYQGDKSQQTELIPLAQMRKSLPALQKRLPAPAVEGLRHIVDAGELQTHYEWSGEE